VAFKITEPRQLTPWRCARAIRPRPTLAPSISSFGAAASNARTVLSNASDNPPERVGKAAYPKTDRAAGDALAARLVILSSSPDARVPATKSVQ
jgi:hypothetical protein